MQTVLPTVAVRSSPRQILRIFGCDMPLPRDRHARMALGLTLVAASLLIPVPVVGFWIGPPGLLLLSKDSRHMRRLRRRSEVRGLRRWRNFKVHCGRFISKAHLGSPHPPSALKHA